MKNELEKDKPYKILGRALKDARLKKRQSIDQVSASVEITNDNLKKIEDGEIKPAEEILEALTEHFKLSENEADKWFELAGYSTSNAETNQVPNQNMLMDALLGINVPKTVIMVSPIDQKPTYTDLLDIHYDSNGLIFNFKQSLGQKEAQTITKLAMSYDHAEKVLNTLREVLIKAKYKKDFPTQQKDI